MGGGVGDRKWSDCAGFRTRKLILAVFSARDSIFASVRFLCRQ